MTTGEKNPRAYRALGVSAWVSALVVGTGIVLEAVFPFPEPLAITTAVFILLPLCLGALSIVFGRVGGAGGMMTEHDKRRLTAAGVVTILLVVAVWIVASALPRV